MRQTSFSSLIMVGLVVIGLLTWAMPAASADTPGVWKLTGSMATSRRYSAMGRLSDGRIIVVGGTDTTGVDGAAKTFYSTAEIYNPAIGTWTSTGSLKTGPRALHTLTLMYGGESLITGGWNGNAALSSAEIYNLKTGTFSATGSMNHVRAQHSAISLFDGRVLITGGFDSSGNPIASAEIYDPATGLFTETPEPMASARSAHRMTAVGNGKVLITGGFGASGAPLATAELFDPAPVNPATDTFTPADSLLHARANHSATELPTGEILVAGGYDGGGVLGSTEIYDPDDNTFTAGRTLNQARQSHSSWVLPNGLLLISGGNNNPSDDWDIQTSFLSSAELYNPATNTFTPTGSKNNATSAGNSYLLWTGKLLAAGGGTNKAELYTPNMEGTLETWVTAANMNTARANANYSYLDDGRVIMIGGLDSSGNPLASAELYDYLTGNFSPTGSMATPRQHHYVTRLYTEKILVTGGRPSASANVLNSAELYDPVSGTFSLTATGNPPTVTTLNRYRRLHKATPLPDGRVLITGGLGGQSNTAGAFLTAAEIYDPATEMFTFTTDGPAVGLNTGRYNHQAILLYTGQVLIVGGVGSGNPNNVLVKSAELYDPATGIFTTTGEMITGRNNPLLTPLPDGKILVSNGHDSVGATTGTPIQTIEIYDPATGKFTAAGNTLVARYGNRVTRLDNGKTIFVGGQTTADPSPAVTNSAELYNHVTGVTGTFSATGSLITGRRNFAQWSLANGRVLVAGGYDASGTVLSSAELYTPLIADEVDTTITSGPDAVTGSTSATFTFTSTAPDSTFHCSLDASPFVACTSGKSYSSLANGSHIFQVHATDTLGNTDPTPATYDWTVDTTVPVVTSFKINRGALSTNNAAVTLNNTATKLPTHYMASEDSLFAGAIWQKYSAAPSFALSSGSDTKTVYFKVKNAFHESAFVIGTISAEAPAVTSFKINADAAKTAKGKVTLNNTATKSPTHYMASEDSNFTGAEWQPYSTAPSFNLSPVSASPEKKTVYFRVKNSFAESSPAKSDDISAAGLPPVVTSFKINAGAATTAKGKVTLNNTATNSPTHYMASEKLDFSDAEWQPYSTAPSFNLSVNLTGGDETKTVHFKVKNIFGESSPPAKSGDIRAQAPAVTSFKINADAAKTAKGKVTLNNTATKSPTHYMASEDSNFTGAEWQPYSTAPSFNLSPVSASPEKKTVYFRVKNSFAESSPAKSDDISAAGLPPAVTSFKINANAATTAKGKVTLNNTATNSPTHYMASEDSNFTGAEWQPYSMAPSFNLSVNLTGGDETKTVHFKVKNIFGESSPPAKSDDIQAQAPAVTSFKINANAATTAKGKVTLNNTATKSPTHYMASEDSNFTGAEWQPYSTGPSFNLSAVSASPETKTVYFKVKNSFAESSPAKSDSITVSGGLPPVVTSFKINAGVASTANGVVTLNNTGTSSPMYYAASESPTFAGAVWETYSTVPKFTLSAGSGTKTVYFKTMNIFGESYVVSDTIFLY